MTTPYVIVPTSDIQAPQGPKIATEVIACREYTQHGPSLLLLRKR
jgi:hypothetical protein